MAYWKLELQLYLSLWFNYCTHLLMAFPHSCQKDVNTSLHFVVVCTFALLKLPKKFLACFATWQSHSELHLPKRASNHTEKWVGGSSLSLFIERERENAKNFRIKETPARQVVEGYRHRWRGGLVLLESHPEILVKKVMADALWSEIDHSAPSQSCLLPPALSGCSCWSTAS